jgi:hypothetical protein
VVLALVGAFIAAFSVLGVVSFAKGRPWGPVLPWASDHCRTSQFGCNVVTQFLFTWAALVVGFWVFLFLGYTRVRRAYVRYARTRPSELVETAGSIVGPVVGRDELCDILQDDLRYPSSRQPHVLVGGLGIGKTAVLVQLTKLLANRGAVPVPIRLRDAEKKLDFLELARQRFVDVLGYRLRSAAEADRVWHELRSDDRIVVLADGLEEAFADEDTYDRDHKVRAAVSEAGEQDFPLVIASRPHEALRALDAAKVHIEPLSEEIALKYLEGTELVVDDPRLYWVVETAEVTETPLYLRIARELHAEGLLEHHSVDARSADRVPLRIRLMKAWVDALISGKLHHTKDIPLTRQQREATVAHLEALACMAMRYDTQQLDLSKHWPLDERLFAAKTAITVAERNLHEREHEAALADEVARAAEREASQNAAPQRVSDDEPETAEQARADAWEAGSDEARTRRAFAKVANDARSAADEARRAVSKARAALTDADTVEDTVSDETVAGAPATPERDVRQADLRIVAGLQAEVQATLDELNTTDTQTAEVLDMQAAASRGIQLRLVDHSANGVRFPHSIMQAYLGSRAMHRALSEEPMGAYVRHGLTDPGREFLMALVMYCRGTELAEDPDDDANPGEPDDVLALHRRKILDELWSAAGGKTEEEERAEEETDAKPPGEATNDPDASETEPDEEADEAKPPEGKPADADVRKTRLPETKQLDVIAAAVEVALAIELVAIDHPERPKDKVRVWHVAGYLSRKWADIKARDDTALTAKLTAIARVGDAARVLAQKHVELPNGPPGLYESLYWICRQEDSYPVRLAAAQQIAKGGDGAWQEIKNAFDTDAPEQPAEDKWGKVLASKAKEPHRRTPADDRPPDEEQRKMPRLQVEWDPATERRYALQGWLLPMLVRSVEDPDCVDEATARLGEWVALAPDLPLTLEAALAQGFKHAANRRPSHSHEQIEARGRLQHHAATMIHRARFWYARLTLLHALCLWEIARLEMPGHAGDDPVDPHEPYTLVERWMRRSGAAQEQDQMPWRQRRAAERQEDHPFVRKAADLVYAALVTRRPDRYIWIDESGVVSTIGSGSRQVTPHGKRSLWISPSAGWIALDRRAKQLVADVQILLNLAERGDTAQGRETRLWQTNRGKLPLCLSEERREHLMPSQTVGMADIPDPGDECKRRCPVELCPYPPRGDQPYRVELSEAFCRHQATLIKRFRPRASWQETSWRELRTFWREMEERARK